MSRRIAVCLFLCALLGLGASFVFRSRGAYAQQNSPTPATIMAGTQTPTAAGITCGPGMASTTSSTLYNQTGVTGNTIWKCATTDGVTFTWTAPFVTPQEVSGTTVSIGGSLLVLNSTTSGTATVAGATPGQNCIATRSDGALPTAGTIIDCAVTAANTVTVRLTALISSTPSSSTYNVRIFQ